MPETGKWKRKRVKRIHLRFDGVYMDSALYINDCLAGEWKYGYSTFEYDVTDFLHEGENLLVMRVVHQSPNSRWYSGAGIYRNVWLLTVPEVHIASDGIYVSAGRAEHGYELRIESELVDGRGGAPKLPEGKFQLRYTLWDASRKDAEMGSGRKGTGNGLRCRRKTASRTGGRGPGMAAGPGLRQRKCPYGR